MKKIICLILSLLLLLLLVGCGSENLEVPEAVIEKRVEEFVSSREIEENDGYSGKSLIITSHNPNGEDHTDTVQATLKCDYKYGQVIYDLQYVFQYDRTSDLWSCIDNKDNTRTVLDKNLLTGSYSADWFGVGNAYHAAFVLEFGDGDEVTVIVNSVVDSDALGQKTDSWQSSGTLNETHISSLDVPDELTVLSCQSLEVNDPVTGIKGFYFSPVIGILLDVTGSVGGYMESVEKID